MKIFGIRGNIVCSFAVLVGVVLAGCNHMDLDGPTGEFMMVNMNTSMETPVTFSFDGMKANTSSVGYGANSGYISIKNGDYNLEVLDGTESPVYQQESLTIQSGERYSFFIYGQSDVETVLIEDKFIASEKAVFRFLNFIEDLPKVSLVSVTDSTMSAIVSDRTSETTQSANEHASFLEIEPGPLLITLVEKIEPETEEPPTEPEEPDTENIDPGINEGEEEEEPVDRGLLLDPQKIDFKAGGHYTIIASGQPGSAEYPLKITVIKNK